MSPCPAWGGLEAHRELRKIDPELRTILSSGYADAVVDDAIQDLGISAFLQKPYTRDTLKKTVKGITRDRPNGDN